MNVSMSSILPSTDDISSNTSTTTTTTTQPPTTTTSTTTIWSTKSMYGSTQTADIDSSSEAVILGSVCGGLALVGIILVVVVCLVLRRRRRQRATKPPMLPDLNVQVVLQESQSTTNLVDNQFPAARVSQHTVPSEPESPTGGDSAGSLPLAPPVPNYEPPELQEDIYVNRGVESDIQGDYVAPSVWQPPVTEDLYMPMAASTNSPLNDLNLQKPVPSHELVQDYTLPPIPKPPACKGSLGYVNVPNSENGNTKSGNGNTSFEKGNMNSGKTYTLPKYANLMEKDEEEEIDYENVKEAKALAKAPYPSNDTSATKSPIPTKAKSSAHQMADILVNSCKTKGSPKQKQSPNKTKTHTKQNSSSSSASSTPKSKHKIPNPPSSDGSQDYVNVKSLIKNNGKR